MRVYPTRGFRAESHYSIRGSIDDGKKISGWRSPKIRMVTVTIYELAPTHTGPSRRDGVRNGSILRAEPAPDRSGTVFVGIAFFCLLPLYSPR